MRRGGAFAQLGPYELIRRLSVGGCAEVFSARLTTSPSEKVAIKRLLPHLSEDPELRRLFYAEAQLLTHLKHPLIAEVFEVHPWESGPFLVMELLEGLDLHALSTRLHSEEATLSAAELCAIGLQAAEALDAAHHAVGPNGQPLQLVHRDVSPHNVMLLPSGLLKLIDFGIATFQGREGKTRTGTLKGKHAYMSPEQVRGEHLDGRSDLFALGVVLWELAAGRALFAGESVIEILERVEAAEVPDLQALRSDLPQDFVNLVRECLARTPEGRPARGAEVSASLGLLLDTLAPKGEPADGAAVAKRVLADTYQRHALALQSGLTPCEDPDLHETTEPLAPVSPASRDQTAFFDSHDIAAHLERLRAEARQR